jgi:hypothetical protein
MMRAAAIAGACLGASALVAPVSVRADKDGLTKLIREYCLDFRGTPDAALARAMKAKKLGPQGEVRDTSSPYATSVGFVETPDPLVLPGSMVMVFSSPSKSQPVSGCEVVAHSDDLDGVVARLRTAYRLGEEIVSPTGDNSEAAGRGSFGGRPFEFKLYFDPKQKGKSGAFNFTVIRGQP